MIFKYGKQFRFASSFNQVLLADPSEFWKLEDHKLINKGNDWQSNEEWNFITQGNMILIKNVSKKQVLGISTNAIVIEKDEDQDDSTQLWKKGKPDAEGFFILENSQFPMVMTAMSSNTIKIQCKFDCFMCNPYVNSLLCPMVII